VPTSFPGETSSTVTVSVPTTTTECSIAGNILKLHYLFDYDIHNATDSYKLLSNIGPMLTRLLHVHRPT